MELVGKWYGDHAALEEVSHSFVQGQITAVIGRSGCGKSTLLKLCNGLVCPDTGSVRVFGQPMNYADLPALRRRLGYAVQGTGLFPHLNVRDNITLLASLQRWQPARIQQRLMELLQLTHLEADQLTRYPHQLSGGQQQRVGLCRAMMLRPEVLLLDEPFAAIDPITRIDIHQQLLAVHRAEPTTVVLVTHDMQEAIRLADHLVIMDAGRVRSSTSKAALVQANPNMEADALLQSLMTGAPA